MAAKEEDGTIEEDNGEEAAVADGEEGGCVRMAESVGAGPEAIKSTSEEDVAKAKVV